MKEYKQELSKLICDACDFKVSKNDDLFKEFISIEHICGNSSIHNKNHILTVDYCQECFAEICFDHFSLTDIEDINICESAINNENSANK